VHEVTGGRGADVVLDNMGAAYLARNVDVLAVHGWLVVIGLQGGMRAELDLGRRMAKRATVTAMSPHARPAHEKAAIVTAVQDHVWPLLADGRVRPVVEPRAVHERGGAGTPHPRGGRTRRQGAAAG
jgi:NADPH:quinone reductase-like Zn-dependent oxidoreductase